MFPLRQLGKTPGCQGAQEPVWRRSPSGDAGAGILCGAASPRGYSLSRNVSP